MTAVEGFVAPGFEPVRERFAGNFEERGEVGAAFAATLDGELVVDLRGGVRDSRSGDAWEDDTLCVIFSGTKGLTAVCLLQLIERGLLALDAPVCECWPEFAAHGKEGVLVRHVVSHQAGLPGFRRPVAVEDLPHAELMAALLADERLFWPPGSRTWYHPITYGYLCGELVRRVAGTSIGAWLRREVAEPLGADMWIGLPAEHERRVATCELAPDWGAMVQGDVADPASERDFACIWNNPESFGAPLPWNSRAWHAAEMPGGNGLATARAMARLYGALACDGRHGDVEVLRPETIALGRALLADGVDPTGQRLTYGVGWRLQNEDREYGPVAEAFGHAGAGGSMHGAWPQERVGFSYVMNRLCGGMDDDRAAGLLRTLHACAQRA